VAYGVLVLISQVVMLRMVYIVGVDVPPEPAGKYCRNCRSPLGSSRSYHRPAQSPPPRCGDDDCRSLTRNVGI
jgi:hypothetical protein